MPSLSFPSPPEPSRGRSFLDVVEAHGAALAGVRDRATLAAWHADFARAWARDAERLAADANRTLGLQGVQAIQPDVGYLAVESAPTGARRAHRWMLVSLNPGWSAKDSPKERTAKGQAPDAFSLTRYEDFRTRFFPHYPAMVGAGCGWWTRALGFLHAAAGLERPARERGRLRLHADLDVTGWELWPFHSDRDGLSARAGWDDDAGRALTDFSMESLQAACRVAESEGRRVVVASAKARRLLERDQARKPAERAFEPVPGTRAAHSPHDVWCGVYCSRSGGQRLHVVGVQIFAGKVALTREARQRVVAFVRGEDAGADG